jgi:2-phospho-L-lactate guanylyltransferase
VFARDGNGRIDGLAGPIDVPTVTPADFSRLAASARPGLIVVPSSDGTGTNALVRTPPDCIESRFGPGSFRAHLDQALSKGFHADVLRIPGLMFDIDTPEDVAELLASGRMSVKFRLSCEPHAPRNRSALFHAGSAARR